jgi:BlaI family transcriptional regulator, penicillinase repressor
MAPARPSPEILETEWDILDALWTAERATARAVTDALEHKRSWAYSTVKTLLDRMVDKGLVKARQVGNVWEYEPALPKRKAQRWAWRRFVDTAFGGAVAPTLAFVAEESGLGPEEKAALRALLDKVEAQAD